MEARMDKYDILTMVGNELNKLTVTGIPQMQSCVKMDNLLGILLQMLKAEDQNRNNDERVETNADTD